MAIIYFNNFRGFESTFLSLKDVNFFVGENSTGKTSLLKLIGIISSRGFWRYGEFGDNETDLGGFSEIITANIENEFLEIGMLGDIDTTKIHSSIKLKFISNNNFPQLKEICYRDDKVNIQIVIDGKTLKYRYSSIDNPSIIGDEEFKSWIRDNKLGDRKFDRCEVSELTIAGILSQIMFKLFSETNKIELLAKEAKINLPIFLNNIAWIAPVRAVPEPVYYSRGLKFDSGGKHAPVILKEILLGPDVKKILNRFGEDSGLYKDIEVRELPNDLTNAFELLLNINGIPLKITNVGFGVSQILPIVIEIIARQNETWFAMQQPEVHLHPRAQAAFGDFIYKSNRNDEQKFIIETHSDYTIDRFRLRINKEFKERKTENSNAQVVFFNKLQHGNKLETLEIQPDGSYPEDQPAEFKAFFIREQLNLITI